MHQRTNVSISDKSTVQFSKNSASMGEAIFVDLSVFLPTKCMYVPYRFNYSQVAKFYNSPIPAKGTADNMITIQEKAPLYSYENYIATLPENI